MAGLVKLIGVVASESLLAIIDALRRRERTVEPAALEEALSQCDPSARRFLRDWVVGRWHLARSEHVEAYESLYRARAQLSERAPEVRADALAFGVQDAFIESCFLLTNYAEAYRAARALVAGIELEPTSTHAQLQLAHALAWLGAAQVQQGFYQEAVGSLSRSIELFDALGAEAASARARNALGIVFEENGDFPSAYQHYAAAHDMARRDGHRDMEGRALANWGDALIANHEVDEGLKKLDEAIALLESIGAYWHSGWCELAIGKAHAHSGRMEDALAMHKRALGSVRKCAVPRVEAEVLAGLGELHGKMGDYELARMQLEYALALATRAGIDREIFKTHHMLALTHKQFGNFERALYHFEEFHVVRTKLYDELSKAKLAQIVDEQAFARLTREQADSRARNSELKMALDEVRALNLQLTEKALELEYLSNQDVLTGLHNRRFLYTRFNEEIGRAERHRLALSIVLYDLDHFKDVNDRFTHEVGDDVLRNIARIISAVLRQSDIHVRYGGEEFAVLMPQTDPAAALRVAEKCRDVVAKFDWTQIAPGLTVTISVGVVSMSPGETMAAVLRRVDAKLYEAKRGGRDRVVQG